MRMPSEYSYFLTVFPTMSFPDDVNSYLTPKPSQTPTREKPFSVVVSVTAHLTAS